MRYLSLAVMGVLFSVGCSSKPKEVKPVVQPSVKKVEAPKNVKVAKPMNGTITTTDVSGGATANAKGKNQYEAACAADDALGCERLAILYGNGLGVVKDMYKSTQLYQKSCQLGNGWACGIVGDRYEDGEGVSQSYEEAARYNKMGCDLGNALSCNTLGLDYIKGRGVLKDYNMAESLLKKSISLGNDSYNNLGYLYEAQGDRERAVSNYKKACDIKNKTGCSNLANLYKKEQNYAFAYPYYVTACNYGKSDACNSATMMIFNKEKGVTEGDETMLQLALRSCEFSNKTGCANVGYLYKNGRGVAQNSVLAHKYYQKACELGDKDSCGL